MPSRSSANLLDLAIADPDFPSSPHHPARLPHVMVDPYILSTINVIGGSSPPASSSPPLECWIIISYHLPLCMTPNLVTPFGWSFSYDPDTLILQLHSSLPVGAKVLHVGTLHDLPNGLDPAHHDAIADHLRREFYYVPILPPPPTSMPPSTMTSASTTFGPSSTTSSPSVPHPSMASVSISLSLSLWCCYLSANKFFTNRLTKLLNPDENFV